MVEREKLISMVRGLQNGEPDAATELYETFQSDIYYFILKTVNNDCDLAEDLTQDTFVEILETIDKLQEPAAFVTWSKQIAYHKCTGYFKKRKELLADEDEDGYSIFDTAEEEREEFIPDAALDKDDLKQTILGMINDLPEEQRSALILRYFNEISVKEIASIQGVSEGTVKSRLNYGRKSIKQAVEDYEKKSGVKLHCAGVLPLMLWFFKNYRVKNDLHISSNTAVQSFVIVEESYGTGAIMGSSASAAASASTAAAAVTGTATTTATVAAVKASASIGAKALATKIIAGVAAAVITVGGVSVGIGTINHNETAESAVVEPQETWVEEITTVVDETKETPEGEQDATAEVSTEMPTEVPTEVSTEVPTAAPTEAPTEAPAEAPTEAPAEAPTEVSTEAPTEAPTEVSTEAPTEAPTELPTEQPAGCSHEWAYQTRRDGDYYYEERYCPKCWMIETLSQTPDPCQHVWFEWTAYDVDMIYVYQQCSNCSYVRRLSESPNTCGHTWSTVITSDATAICRYDECTSCTAVTNAVNHQWEEQYIFDENGEVAETYMYCPNCSAIK